MKKQSKSQSKSVANKESKLEQLAKEQRQKLNEARSHLADHNTLLLAASAVKEALTKVGRYPQLVHEAALSNRFGEFEFLLTNYTIAQEEYAETCRALKAIRTARPPKRGVVARLIRKEDAEIRAREANPQRTAAQG